MKKRNGKSGGVEFREDAFENFITGIGTARDKRTYHTMQADAIMQPEEIDLLYHGNDLAATIVDALVEDALLQGFEPENGDDEAEADDASSDETKLCQAIDKWKLVDTLAEAARWGRAFGGAAIFLGVDGAGQPWTPLDDTSGRGVLRFLKVYDRRDLTPETRYEDRGNPKYGQVETYRLTMTADSVLGGVSAVKIHETRLIMFGGAPTSRRKRRENAGWDHSVLQKVQTVLRDTDQNWQSVCHLMTDLSQMVIRLKGLITAATTNKESVIRKRMEIIDMGRSVARALLLDADTETGERITTSLAGVDVMLDKTWQRMAAAAGMPVTRLFGMSPAGMNATGEYDDKNWSKRVGTYRTRKLNDPATRLMRWVARTEGIANPDKWSVCWPSLDQPTAKEQAEIDLLEAQRDKVYVDGGVWMGEEVAIWRAGQEGGPKIDIAMRQKILTAATKQALEPPPPPVMPTPPPPDSKAPPGQQPPPPAPTKPGIGNA